MKKTPPLSIYKKIATIFISVTVILVLAIFYYSLTYAFVSVKGKVSEQTFNYNLAVTQSELLADASKGVFSGNIINQEVNLEGKYPATGKKTVAKNLSGTVKIINNNSKDQQLIKTTRLLTAIKELFRISDNVVVPKNGGTVEVGVYADNPDLKASVAAGQKLIIPGLIEQLYNVIFAEAVVDFTGQTEDVTLVTKEDLEGAIADLIKKAEEQVRQTIGGTAQAVLSSEVLSKDFSSLAEAQVADFTAKARVNVKGVKFNASQVKDFTRQLVESRLNENYSLTEIDEAQSSYSIESFDPKSNSVYLQGKALAKIKLRKDSPILNAEKMTKLKASEVEAYLKNYDEIESVKVSFFPFWTRRTPSFPDHIVVSVE